MSNGSAASTGETNPSYPHDISCSYSIKITLRTRILPLCSVREPTTSQRRAAAQVGHGKSARLGLIPGRPNGQSERTANPGLNPGIARELIHFRAFVVLCSCSCSYLFYCLCPMPLSYPLSARLISWPNTQCISHYISSFSLNVGITKQRVLSHLLNPLIFTFPSPKKGIQNSLCSPRSFTFHSHPFFVFCLFACLLCPVQDK